MYVISVVFLAACLAKNKTTSGTKFNYVETCLLSNNQ